MNPPLLNLSLSATKTKIFVISNNVYLNVEVERLRNDARNVSEHSRAVMQFLFIIGLTYCISFIFKKIEEKDDER